MSILPAREESRIACLRLPKFPLQWLYRKRPEWRGSKVVWLEKLKPDAPLRYLSSEATREGLKPGMRYATALGLLPELLAGTCEEQELEEADTEVVELLHRFTPRLRRGREQRTSGLYLLETQGLGLAFGGMRSWADKLLESLKVRGWNAVIALGYTTLACELATHDLGPKSRVFLFSSRAQEQSQTMRQPLSLLGFPPEPLNRLRRFGIQTLEQFLALDEQELLHRFGRELAALYRDTADSFFRDTPTLTENKVCTAEGGFPEPVYDLASLLAMSRRLLSQALPRLARQEEAVSQMHWSFETEEGETIKQQLCPTFPTLHIEDLLHLLRLRLERHFQDHRLKPGQRIERVSLSLLGEPDPEKQGQLFSGWGFEEEEAAPRDHQAALWALSRVRAEYGEDCLRCACLQDHMVPGRDFVFRVAKESAWDPYKDGAESGERQWAASLALRVRRCLGSPLPLATNDRWNRKEGPYLLQGGWWESKPFSRRYFFARVGAQTGWLYADELQGGWFAQGWLQ